MGMESGTSTALVLGLLLGLKHASDADHVVAVSTIINESRNAWRGTWIGVSWGLGHSIPLLGLGLIILTFKETVLEKYEIVAPVLEFGVGIMLVVLGVSVFRNLRRGRLHIHEHTHNEKPHLHVHATHKPDANAHVELSHSVFRPGKPFFRVKSFVIGAIHGLAGSAAVMLVLLPMISSFWVGIGYLLLFSVGTMLSMAVITLMLGIPFALTSNIQHLNRVVSGLAGTASVLLGVGLMSDIALGTRIIPF